MIFVLIPQPFDQPQDEMLAYENLAAISRRDLDRAVRLTAKATVCWGSSAAIPVLGSSPT